MPTPRAHASWCFATSRPLGLAILLTPCGCGQTLEGGTWRTEVVDTSDAPCDGRGAWSSKPEIGDVNLEVDVLSGTVRNADAPDLELELEADGTFSVGYEFDEPHGYDCSTVGVGKLTGTASNDRAEASVTRHVSVDREGDCDTHEDIPCEFTTTESWELWQERAYY